VRITHTVEFIDPVTGQAVYCELVRETIQPGHYVGTETMEFNVPVIEGTTTIVHSKVTLNARQLFDFLEGSGMS
jgi:hypothetical protein